MPGKADRIAARIPKFHTAQETARLVCSFGMYHNIIIIMEENSWAKPRIGNKPKTFCGIIPRPTYRRTLG